MEKLIGWTKADAWGSTNAIPEFLGAAAGDDPVSEVWFGTHPDGPTLLTSGDTLAEHIAADGVEASLTGPAVRGDHATIDVHLACLEGRDRQAYQLLTEQLVDIVRRRAAEAGSRA